MKSSYTPISPILILCAAMLFAGCSGKSKGKASKSGKRATDSEISVDTALQSRLKNFASRPRVSGKFAFCVYDLTAGKEVYACNADSAMSSASCMKLLSGVAGLHLLGTGYNYETAMYTRGKVRPDGTLMGDLAFKAGLDPQLNEPDLSGFARAARAKGIRKIAGRLIVDLTVKSPVQSEPHWYPWDLSFSKYGLLYKGAPRVIRYLKASLRAQGISIADSQVVMARTPQQAVLIHKTQRPIEDVIRRMWKNSSNTQATAMLYSIGHRANPHTAPTEAGVAYLRSFLRDTLGLTAKNLTIHDGCGLCTHNHLSPRALTEILKFGYNDTAIYPLLHNNLSISGVDGTLAREMTRPSTRGKIRAKTGTLSHPYGISSLAGYCEARNGHLLAFAIMDTEMSVLDARVLQRQLGEAMTK